jgi:formate dehydrogenase major subunit
VVEENCGIKPADFDYLYESVTENSGGNGPRASPTRSAGRSTASARNSSAPPRSSSSCWAIWVARAAESWRCAGTRRFRDRPISRPCSTCCPATCRCPAPESTTAFDDYVAAVGTPETHKGYWANGRAYATSLLKAWWGDAATKDNDFAFDYLPRINGAHGTYQTAVRMLNDGVDGYFLLGQNPAVGSANGRMQRMAMSHLKWMVVRDFSLIESATWWKDGPEIETGELKTEDIDTEMFFLPAANHTEKAGTFTQTQRLVQWRHKAVNPPGDAQSELDFFFELGQAVREKLKTPTTPEIVRCST